MKTSSIHLFPSKLFYSFGYQWNFVRKTLFVPNMSIYTKVGSGSSITPLTVPEVDYSGQMTLQTIWEDIIRTKEGKWIPKGLIELLLLEAWIILHTILLQLIVYLDRLHGGRTRR